MDEFTDKCDQIKTELEWKIEDLSCFEFNLLPLSSLSSLVYVYTT